MEDETGFDPRLKTPSNIMVVGPSKSGKTSWVGRLIRERQDGVFRQPLKKVLYCYGEWQPLFETWQGPDVQFVQGIPDDLYEGFDGQPGLLILDDLMAECRQNPDVEKLFTRGTHHRQLTVVKMTQNMFCAGQRTESLNTHYMVVFKNPRDQTQLLYLLRQAFPRAAERRVAEEAFINATRRPYGYLMFDFETDTPDRYRLRTNVFPNDPGPQEVYLAKHE